MHARELSESAERESLGTVLNTGVGLIVVVQIKRLTRLTPNTADGGGTTGNA